MQVVDGLRHAQAPCQILCRVVPFGRGLVCECWAHHFAVDTFLVSYCGGSDGLQIPAVLSIVAGNYLGESILGLIIGHISEGEGNFAAYGRVLVASHLVGHLDELLGLSETQRPIGYQSMLYVLGVQ